MNYWEGEEGDETLAQVAWGGFGVTILGTIQKLDVVPGNQNKEALPVTFEFPVTLSNSVVLWNNQKSNPPRPNVQLAFFMAGRESSVCLISGKTPVFYIELHSSF